MDERLASAIFSRAATPTAAEDEREPTSEDPEESEYLATTLPYGMDPHSNMACPDPLPPARPLYTALNAEGVLPLPVPASASAPQKHVRATRRLSNPLSSADNIAQL